MTEPTTDTTAPERDDALEVGLRNLARTWPATYGELAGAAEVAKKLGVRGEDVSDLAALVLQVGAAASLTADKVTRSVARFADAMDTPHTPEERP